MYGSLRKIREKMGMTQAELAKKSGVSRTTISMLENGRAGCVKTVTLTKLADTLEKRVGDLFFSSESPTS